MNLKSSENHQQFLFQFDIGSCGLMNPGSSATVHIDYRYLKLIFQITLSNLYNKKAKIWRKKVVGRNPIMLLIRLLFPCFTLLTKSQYHDDAGLCAKMRFLWRKARVWQFSAPTWAEDTSCTGPPHHRYTQKWSTDTTCWQNLRWWRYPHQKLKPHTLLSEPSSWRLAPFLLSSPLGAGGKKTFSLGLQVFMNYLFLVSFSLYVLTYFWPSGFQIWFVHIHNIVFDEEGATIVVLQDPKAKF